MAVKIQLRGDTAANWTSADPTLAEREVGIETDTLKLKVGDGSTAWSGLSYIAGSGGVEHYIGDWDPTGDVLPSTGDGGNGTAGVAAQGDRWRLQGADYKGIAEGSIIEAAIDDPQDDDDWNFIGVQIP